MTKTPRTLIVTKMKNEGPFILEWLAYHLSIGIEDYLIYSNDCTDGTDKLLNLLDKKGYITHRENPFREMGKSVHMGVYSASRKEKIFKNADWIVTTDVDEFINVHVGDGSINALYEAMPDANLISMAWRLFGNSDVHKYQNRSVLRQFTQCAATFCPRPMKAWCFKTLFKNNGIYRRLDTHRPKGLDQDRLAEIHWVNGSGTPLERNEKLLMNQRRATARTVGFDMVTLNHYAVRSAESFVVKSERGDAIDELSIGLNYWFNLNHNTEKDDRILARFPAMRKVLDTMLADPDILAAHRASVQAHEAHIKSLMERDQFKNLYNQITSDRMQKLSRMHPHFAQSVYSPEGYAAIPEGFEQREYPANHIFSALDQENYPEKDPDNIVEFLFKLDPFYDPAKLN